MSETKHNIGPVNVIPAGEGNHSLLSPEREDEPHYTAIIQANDDELSARVAALFAAAPDMLEALTALLMRLDDNPELSDLIGQIEIERARAAIAKAEGRS